MLCYELALRTASYSTYLCLPVISTRSIQEQELRLHGHFPSNVRGSLGRVHMPLFIIAAVTVTLLYPSIPCFLAGMVLVLLIFTRRERVPVEIVVPIIGLMRIFVCCVALTSFRSDHREVGANALAHRLLQCLTVAIRPLRVEELAEALRLAVEFDTSKVIPKLNGDLRQEDQEKAESCAIRMFRFPV